MMGLLIAGVPMVKGQVFVLRFRAVDAKLNLF